MYNTAKSCIKLPDGITDTFRIQKGIKQGDTLSPYLFNLYLNDINKIFTDRCCPPQIGEHKVYCLVYADDLLIISENKEGLQHSLNKLHIYCKKWKLKVNIKKTKAIIFRNRGKLEDVKFWYGQNEISITDKYTYLGITFTENGKLNEAVKVLHDKAIKGMFSLSSSLYTGITIKPQLPLSLFDSTIRPILMYGAEVWGSEFYKLLSKPSQIDKAPFEEVQNKFCKYIAGVPRRASNFAIKAELGRNPIFSTIVGQILRYWKKLIDTDANRILKSAYNSEIEIHRNGGNSWVTLIITLLEISKSGNVGEIQDSSIYKEKVKEAGLKAKRAVNELYFNHNYGTIGRNSKLRTYAKFKTNFEMETYMQIEDMPFKCRQLFCAFRISCHDLEIERGRYQRVPKPPEERICKLCKIQAETEEHFIVFCPEFTDKRTLLFKEIYKIEPEFQKMNNNTKFIFLMSSTNITIIRAVMTFIKDAYRERALLLRSK